MTSVYDERRRRWSALLGIRPEDPPERVEGMISDLEARGITPEALEDRLGLRASNPFERYVTRPMARFGDFVSHILPAADPQDVRDMRAPGGLPDAIQTPFLSFLPRSFETEAPEPLQPAARVIRGVVSPGGIATAGLGGARLGAASILGSAALGTVGAQFGPQGELVGSLIGGILPGARVAPRVTGILPGVPEEIAGGQALRGGARAAPRVAPPQDELAKAWQENLAKPVPDLDVLRGHLDTLPASPQTEELRSLLDDVEAVAPPGGLHALQGEDAPSALRDRWAGKRPNSRRLESELDSLDDAGFDTSDVRSSLEEYRDLERSGMTAEEFAEERASLWESALDSLNDMEPPEAIGAIEALKTAGGRLTFDQAAPPSALPAERASSIEGRSGSVISTPGTPEGIRGQQAAVTPPEVQARARVAERREARAKAQALATGIVEAPALEPIEAQPFGGAGIPEEIGGGQAARTPAQVQAAIRAQKLRELAEDTAPFIQGTRGVPGEAVPGTGAMAPRMPLQIDAERIAAEIAEAEAGAPPPFRQFEPGSQSPEAMEMAFGRQRPLDADVVVKDAYGAASPTRYVTPTFDDFYGRRTGRAEISPLGDIEGTGAGPGPILRSALEEIYGPYSGTPPLGRPPPVAVPEETFYEIAGRQRPQEPVVNDYPFPRTGTPVATATGAGAPPPVPPGPIPVPGGTTPPPPPTTPAAISALPPELDRSLKQAAAMVKVDAPTTLATLVSKVPVLHKAYVWYRPGRTPLPDLPGRTNRMDRILGAQIGEFMARVELNDQFLASRRPLLARMEEVFGRGASTGAETPVRFTGGQADRNKIVGTVVDIADRPHLYDLSAEQKQFLADFDTRNTELLNQVNTGYGTEIGQYVPRPGGTFISSIDKNEDAVDVMERAYGLRAGSRRAVTGRSHERYYQTRHERMLADPSFDPETDVQKILRGMDASKASAAGAKVVRAGVGGLETMPAAQGAIAHTYTKSVELGVYLPADEVKIIEKMREDAKGGLPQLIAEGSATVLGGDFSPIGVQFLQKVIYHPAATAEQFAKGKWAFRVDNIAKLIRDDPQGWKDYAAATGRSITEPTPGEFSTGFLGRIPKAGPKIETINNSMYNFVQAMSKNDFARDMDSIQKAGHPREEALALAGDLNQKLIPSINAIRYGLSPAQMQARRPILTSVSFVVKSAELLTDATSGFAKIMAGGVAAKAPGATGSLLTPKEALAVNRVTRAAAFVGTISVASAVVEAQRTGQDPIQAALDSVNPDKSQFLSLVVLGKRIPLGGPLRALFQGVFPRKVSWSPVPVPFGGMSRYVSNRFSPWGSTALNIRLNRDERGRPIWHDDENMVARILEYVGESVIPAAPGGAAGDARRGELGLETAVSAAGQVGGLNVIPLRTITDLRKEWESGLETYEALPTNPREARDKRVLSRETYRQRNPEADARLFIIGDVQTLMTIQARQIALELMRQNNIRMGDVRGFKVQGDYESNERKLLRQYFARQLGEKPMKGARPGEVDILSGLGALR